MIEYAVQYSEDGEDWADTAYSPYGVDTTYGLTEIKAHQAAAREASEWPNPSRVRIVRRVTIETVISVRCPKHPARKIEHCPRCGDTNS